ncbi:ATP-dependent RNA helicase DHR2, partial [Lecanoromycetidae sp. Uapishka_2]
MPERVHQRFESESSATQSAIVNRTEASTLCSTINKKRKRQHIDQENLSTQDAPLNNGKASKQASPDSKPPWTNSVQSALVDGKGTNGHQNSPNGITKGQASAGNTALRPKSGAQNQHQGLLKDKARALWPIRKALPIWAHAAEIRQGLREKDVMLLVGETGSGKSTQVPQILAEEAWCKAQSVVATAGKPTNNYYQEIANGANEASWRKCHVGGCIAITEPRRVAAITLARRVAEEMGTPLGSSSPSSKVGYSVRFDNSTSPSTKIKFLTEGMLLQEMLRDPWLTAYSAVIVDEVHERGVNVDLVLGFLRRMSGGRYEGRGGVPLKVAIMSATAEMERLGSFFEEAYEPESEVGERFEPLVFGKTTDSSDESEWSGIHSTSSEEGDISPAAHTNGGAMRNGLPHRSKPLPSGLSREGKSSLDGLHDDAKILSKAQVSTCLTPRIATCYIEGRQYPVKINYTPEPAQDFVDAALRTIFQIHYKEPMPGDVLVFLTGQETVESLESLVKEYALGMSPDVPKMLVLPLFAALPQSAQQRVFQPAPPKTRKIILATNIAETSVTVSGVRFVIDCGKAKTKQFRTRIGLDSLLVKPISKSAAIQRKGRAGREAPGQCYRLYTEQAYLDLQQSNTPEILRSDLSHSILTMKARGVDDVVNFPFLDYPPREALEKALLQLYQLGALRDSGSISEIGHQMAKLPLTVSLGRVLIAATEVDFDCVSQVIDIISCLSVENIFLNLTSEEKKEEAEIARRELFRREGDHLTLLTTVQAYAAENSDRKAWAEKHYVSHRAMQAVMDVRKQLRTQNPRVGGSSDSQQPEAITSELGVRILKCFLKGFATNTARLFPDGSYKTMVGNQSVAIHPSSGLFGKKVEAIMYNEFVFTNRSYARGVSAVQMDWIGEALGV